MLFSEEGKGLVPQGFAGLITGEYESIDIGFGRHHFLLLFLTFSQVFEANFCVFMVEFAGGSTRGGRSVAFEGRTDEVIAVGLWHSGRHLKIIIVE